MFPVNIAGSIRFRIGALSATETIKAVTSRIAGMLHWEKARSVTIAGSSVTFTDDRWRLKAKSMILLFERGVFDVEADNAYVRVRYRVGTTHQTITTLFIATVFGALSAITYKGPLNLKVLAALVGMGWIGGWLWGIIFVSAKIYVPLWLRKGLRNLPELQKR